MKNKLAAILTILSLSVSTASYAADKVFSVQEEKIVFDSNDKSVISCYDNDKLMYSVMCTPDNGKISVEIPERFADMEKRVYTVGENDVYTLIENEEPTPTPTPSPSGAPIVNTKDYPSVYPSESDASAAFMICEDIETVQSNDEEAYKITAYYLGKEIEVVLQSDVKIQSTAQINIDITDENASALKRGDVFRLTYNVAKTRVTRIDLIYRPDIKTIATDENDYGQSFENLFAYKGNVGGIKNWYAASYGQQNTQKYLYAFGIVVDKSSSDITLMNKSGKTSDAMEIDIDKDTVVYNCNTSGRKYEISSVNTAGITKTYVKSSILDDDNIIDWDDSYKYSYALVRIIDGTATDIAVFNND